MADGEIIFETALDNKQLENSLVKINSKIQSLSDEIYSKQQKKIPLAKQASDLGVTLDEEKAKLKEMRDRLLEIRTLSKDKEISPGKREFYAERIPSVKEDLADQQTRVRMLQAEYNKISGIVERYDQRIADATAELDFQKEKAGAVAKELAHASRSSEKMAEAQERAKKSANKFALRLREVTRSALIFTLITQALGKFREWMGKVIKTNKEATSALAKLKGALLTMVQPLVSVIIPALTVLVNILTRIISVIAQLFAMLSGKSVDSSKEAADALNKETEALEGVGSAAKEASGQLAGFDEINQIGGATAAGGGAAGAISPDFGFDAAMTEGQLKNILGLIKAIAAGILAWKLGDGFLDSLGKFLGILLAIDGGIGLVEEAMDAWNNGVTLDNVLGMIGRTAELSAGLWLAFGKIGAGIGLIVGGLTMLVTGFHDAFQNGWNFQNLMLSIAGILSSGLGIAILVGSWIPLLIAGIAALLLDFAVQTGHGEEILDGVRETLEGFIDFFKGVFTGDLELAIGGVGKIFDGLGKVVGALVDGLRDTFNSFLDWLDEKTGGKLHGIIEFTKKMFTVFFDDTKEALLGAIDGIKLIFQGLTKFLSGVFTGDWDLAWEGIKDTFKGVWNGIVSILVGAVNLIIKAVNWLIEKLNGISVDAPDWVEDLTGISTFGFNIPKIPLYDVPKLARGAVVPPNREFMAVLGDNKRETEIVSPLSTMKQAFLEAMQQAGGAGSGTITVVVNLDGREVARNTVRHVNDMTRQAGKPVLLY